MPANLFERIFGGIGERETHEDGSVTQDWQDGTSTTYDPEGKVKEEVHRDYYFFRGEVTVTKDGDGNIINEQDGWGKSSED